MRRQWLACAVAAAGMALCASCRCVRTAPPQAPASVTGATVAQPVVSPDGRRVALTAEGRTRQLIVVDVDRPESPHVVTINLAGFHSPSWAPDGQRLACCGYDGRLGHRLAVCDLRAGATRLVDHPPAPRKGCLYGASVPVWSPTGEWIAFMGDGGLRLVRPDGCDDHAVSPLPHFRFAPLCWTPDGRWLYYLRSEARDVRQGEVYRLDTQAPRARPEPVTRGCRADRIALSPDGQVVLVQKNSAPWSDMGTLSATGEMPEYTYYLVPTADPAARRQLFRLPSPDAAACSPDGQGVAFIQGRLLDECHRWGDPEGACSLWTAPLRDLARARKLLDGLSGLVAWTRRHEIIFTRGHGHSLWVVRDNGKHPRRLWAGQVQTTQDQYATHTPSAPRNARRAGASGRHGSPGPGNPGRLPVAQP